MSIAPPVYDIRISYEENYRNGPVFGIAPPPLQNTHQLVSFLGIPCRSRIGIPAGPLLNSAWIGFYAKMGFDILTYKTVRSHSHPSYQNPNCLYVPFNRPFKMEDLASPLIATLDFHPQSMSSVTITNSFGMPSQPPSVWIPDIKVSLNSLAQNQVLVVSVVGIEQNDCSMPEDFARTAKMAKEAGAMAIEVNFSCPNVKGKEGQLYQSPESSMKVLSMVREAIGETPLIMKVGQISDPDLAEMLLEKTAPYIQGIGAINTVSGTIINSNGQPALPGPGRERSGLCGAGIRNLALQTVGILRKVIDKGNLKVDIIGVGGYNTPDDYQLFINEGADFVMSATGAMWDPYLAYVTKQRDIS
ncbi:MAG: beta/alpha barrel domain-containing protein [Leptospirillum sp.]